MTEVLLTPDDPKVRAMFEERSGHFLNGDNAVEIKSGDWYWAKRAGPARILKCKSVSDRGWITSVAPAYPYDISECYRLKEEFSEDDIILIALESNVRFDEWLKTFVKPTV